MGVKLGTYITSLRKNKGFTVKELADYAKISKSYLDYIESGNREPSPDKLKSIALALDVDVEKLIEQQSEDNLNKAKSTDISRHEMMKKIIQQEKQITVAISDYLERTGWKTIDSNRIDWGDICLQKDNKLWFVEVKIVTDYKKTARMYSNNIIGSLVFSIEKLGYEHKYSIASNNEDFIREFKDSVPKLITDKIDLTFFWVNDMDEVISYN